MTDSASCACLRVQWQTERLPDGLTRGWWECGDCRTEFIPLKASWQDSFIRQAEQMSQKGNWIQIRATDDPLIPFQIVVGPCRW
jgi:hypothetical protein